MLHVWYIYLTSTINLSHSATLGILDPPMEGWKNLYSIAGLGTSKWRQWLEGPMILRVGFFIPVPFGAFSRLALEVVKWPVTSSSDDPARTERRKWNKYLRSVGPGPPTERYRMEIGNPSPKKIAFQTGFHWDYFTPMSLVELWGPTGWTGFFSGRSCSAKVQFVWVSVWVVASTC